MISGTSQYGVVIQDSAITVSHHSGWDTKLVDLDDGVLRFCRGDLLHGACMVVKAMSTGPLTSRLKQRTCPTGIRVPLRQSSDFAP